MTGETDTCDDVRLDTAVTKIHSDIHHGAQSGMVKREILPLTVAHKQDLGANADTWTNVIMSGPSAHDLALSA
jgi:hypothetical protein